MALSISGVLGRSTAYTDDTTGLNQFKAEWLTAAQNQKIQITGTDLDGTVTDYFNPTAVSNLSFDSDAADEANGFKTYGDILGMGVAASYAGWYTDASKIRAEINYDPNTGQSQLLTYKWAPSTTINNAFIDLSRFVTRDVNSTTAGNTEVGFLQAFKNGAAVQISATRMLNETTTASSQTSIQNGTNGVIFTADDATNGDFKFKVLGAFDELRFSSRPYANPSATQPISSFNGKISDSSDYLVQQLKYTGTADTGTLQFSNPVFTVNENGIPVAAVTVTRTGGSYGAVSGTINLSNGSATAPGDYTSTPITVNFADGDTTSKVITIPIVDDTLIEPTETVNLTLTNPTGGAAIGTQNTATLNVVDNDTSLQFSSPTFTVNEDGTPVLAVTVTRTGDTTAPVSATVNLTNGTATAPGDYNSTPITVNFAAGDGTSKIITIPIVDDSLVEGNETVNLTLANPTGGATIGTQGTATLTVIDNDAAGTIQFSGPQYVVREDGTPLLAVTLTRTGGSAGAVSTTVNLADGTAVTPGDYSNSPIAVSWADGDTAPKTITIPIVDDSLIEPDETVNLSLSTPTGGATLGTQNTATLTILDNDSVPVVMVAALDPSAGEPTRNEGTGTFQFSRTGGDISQALTARYTITGTATAGTDYTALSGIVSFAAGQSVSGPVTLTALDDTGNEPLESVVVKVAEGLGYQVGSADTAAVTIADNDFLTGTGAGPVLRYDSAGNYLSSHSNITTAVGAATANNILVIQAGTYNEPGTVFIDKPLTLRGPNAGVSPANASGTTEAIVQGTASQPVFSILPNVGNVTIEGLTIQMNNANGVAMQGDGSNAVIRQNTFTGLGPFNNGVVYLDTGNTSSSSSAQVIDNLMRDVTTAGGSTTSGVQVIRFNTVRITDNEIANLSGPGVASDSMTNGVIAANKVSNMGEQGIQVAGRNGTVDNNDVTNANTVRGADRGGIRVRDGYTTLGTVDVLSNVVTNSYNGIAIRDTTGTTGTVNVNNNNLIGNTNAAFYHGGTGSVNATNNWWDDAAGPVVGGTGRNAIAGSGAALVSYNPYATTPF